MARGLPRPALAIALLAAVWPSAARPWERIEIPPDRDNTLYESPADTPQQQFELSNGAGDFLFVGRAGLDAGFRLRRALLHFDLSAIPAGATVGRVELLLYQSKAAPGSPPAVLGLHRVLQDWGEGSSEGIGAEGQGNLATAGDATWHHRFWPDTPWAAAGGSYAEAASSSVTVGQALLGFTWPCTVALLNDVQSWLDAPGSNYGWILVGGEAAGFSAHRFNSRENFVPAERPLLRVTYLPADTLMSDGFEDPASCE